MASCLVTGATGYIGGRLVPRLLAAGHQVRCLTRTPQSLRDVPWRSAVELVAGDLLDPDAARAALTDIDVAYYLVHSLGSPSFEEGDSSAATTFVDPAAATGVGRIVYPGRPEPAPAVATPHP